MSVCPPTFCISPSAFCRIIKSQISYIIAPLTDVMSFLVLILILSVVIFDTTCTICAVAYLYYCPEILDEQPLTFRQFIQTYHKLCTGRKVLRYQEVNRGRSDNTMLKMKRTKPKTMIYKTLQTKIKIERNELH